MAQISLSICIPTYNFGRFIGATLESIIGQITEGVEIIVVDGASTDNTPDVVRQYQSGCPSLKYYRLDKKGGIDIDMAKTVELAGGEYCWLFSGDDIMRQGSIAKILSQVKSGYDLYLCKHTNCTLDMRFINEHPVLMSDKEMTFDLANPSDRRCYFELAQTSEPFFSFMGGIIIKKLKWDSVPINEVFIGSCWGHVARIFEVMQKGRLTVKYLPEPLLDRRGENDSFSEKGRVNRYGIAIDGFHKLADVFFGHDSFEAYHIRRVIRHEFNLENFMKTKLICWQNPAHEDRKKLDILFRKAYCDRSVLSVIKYLIYTMFPNRVFYIIRQVKRKIIPG
jgi:abequosyltransferase